VSEKRDEIISTLK